VLAILAHATGGVPAPRERGEFAPVAAMPDASALLEHWGYAGIVLAVLLGNIGLPLPEETTLAVAGYAAARGELHFPTVLAVGVISAVVGDNIGYWVGRRYGPSPASSP
jgi:membrane protein DedA with SNARE-associated domain